MNEETQHDAHMAVYRDFEAHWEKRAANIARQATKRKAGKSKKVAKKVAPPPISVRAKGGRRGGFKPGHGRLS